MYFLVSCSDAGMSVCLFWLLPDNLFLYQDYASFCSLLFANAFLALASEDNSRLAARKYARVIQKLGFDVSGFAPLTFFVFSLCWTG